VAEIGWGDVFAGGLQLAGRTFDWMSQNEALATRERLAEIDAQQSIAASQARAIVGVAQAQAAPATATVYTANTRMVVLTGMMIFFGALMLRGGNRGG
jgi:hypothetical protein